MQPSCIGVILSTQQKESSEYSENETNELYLTICHCVIGIMSQKVCSYNFQPYQPLRMFRAISWARRALASLLYQAICGESRMRSGCLEWRYG